MMLVSIQNQHLTGPLRSIWGKHPANFLAPRNPIFLKVYITPYRICFNLKLSTALFEVANSKIIHKLNDTVLKISEKNHV